jgi:hypothetical protein
MLGAEHGDGTEADKGESAKVPASNASKVSAAAPCTTNPALPSRPSAQDSPIPPQVVTATAATAPESRNAHQRKRTHGSALPK